MKTILISVIILFNNSNPKAQFVDNHAEQYRVLSLWISNLRQSDEYLLFGSDKLEISTWIAKRDSIISKAVDVDLIRTYRISVNILNVPETALEFESIYSNENDIKTAFLLISENSEANLEIRVKDLVFLFDSFGQKAISVKRIEF